MSRFGAFLLLVACLTSMQEQQTTGDRPTMTSTPDKPTTAYIGGNVTLTWLFHLPRHIQFLEVAFGFWKHPGYLAEKLIVVNSTEFVKTQPGFEKKVTWAGNLTAKAAAFILYNVQPTDGEKTFGIHVELGTRYHPLNEKVRLLVTPKATSNPAKITSVSQPSLLAVGDSVSFVCIASGSPPVHVKWFKDGKIRSNGVSNATFTLNNVTSKDWGSCVCLASNTHGQDQKLVVIKVRPDSPTILNTETTVYNASWTLRWSTVRSEGILVNLYSVWYQVSHVTDGEHITMVTWLQENVTGHKYHKELTVGTRYKFGVTAWNKWGESLLKNEDIITVLVNFTNFTDSTIGKEETTGSFQTEEPGTPMENWRRHTDISMINDAPIYGGAFAIFVLLCAIIALAYFSYRKRERQNHLTQGKRENRRMLRTPFRPQEHLHNETRRESTDLTEDPVHIQESSLTLQLADTNQSTAACDLLVTPAVHLNSGLPSRFEATSSSYKESISMQTFLPVMWSTGNYCNQVDASAGNSLVRDGVAEAHDNITRADGNIDIYAEVDDGRNEPFKYAAANNVMESGECGPHRERTDSKGYLRPNEEISEFRDAKPSGFASYNPRAKPSTRPRVKLKPKVTFHSEHPNRDAKTHTSILNKIRKRQQCSRCKHVKKSHYFNQTDENKSVQGHMYQNDNCPSTTLCPRETALLSPEPGSSQQQSFPKGEPQYSNVQLNANWEISPERLILFNRIGGGAFGEVWSGVARDLAGTSGWSKVAVKMLKANSSRADLRDLLSELALLKKLETHPNVIRLLGCVTKDALSCRGSRLDPPLVILEFVTHGDLLGYLLKSRGEKDNYYNLKETEVSQRIERRQLYNFALDIARGMEFIASKQLIHRDLAARNVLVGTGPCCKVTDFGMARDLGKSEIYVRRSNGLMPVKWMASEALRAQVFTIQSDVWSYGVVLYEIFTLGRCPYEGMTGEEVYYFVTSGGRLQRSPAIPQEVYDVMLLCWNEEPTERPKFRCLASMIGTLQCVAETQLVHK